MKRTTKANPRKNLEDLVRERTAQLEAANQQLKAANQQLRATEQQLRASNQQLNASNQQLRATQESLRESEARFKRIYDSNVIGIIFWDTAGNITRANREFLRIVGYTEEDVLSGRVRWKDMTPPEYAPLDDKALKEMAETGVSAPFEKEYIRKDGSRAPVVIGAALFKGQKDVGICFVLDIAERKRAEKEKAEAKAYLESSLGSSVAGVLLLDKQARFTYVNPAFVGMLGRKADDFIGKTVLDVSPPFLNPETTKIIAERARKRVQTGEAVSGADVELLSQDGRVIPVSYSAAGIRDKDGEVIGEVVTLIDITERKRAEEEIRTLNAELEQRVRDRTAELEESNSELEAFSYSVSHDLRAPLRAIDGFTRILVEDYEPRLNSEGKRLCSIIRDNTARMSRLIDDLLTFSRLGRAEMQPVSIDMAEMASSVFLGLTTPESRGRMDFKCGPLPPAVGDPSLMRQVWTNLLGNAVKFSSGRERAEIGVSGELREGEAVFSVRDNGAGFDARYAHKLFGVFQRLHSTKEFEGTGVGLALVHRVIRRHGGRVWAEGESDRGATFWFSLPQKGG